MADRDGFSSIGIEQARWRGISIIDELPNHHTNPTNLESILKNYDISVIEYNLPKEKTGILVIKTTGRGVIVVNKNHSLPRRRFSTAHALGHYLLHHQFNTEVYHEDCKSRKNMNRVEHEANAFASELIMPEKVLKNWANLLDLDVFEDSRIKDKARELQVGWLALVVRLKNLKLLAGDL